MHCAILLSLSCGFFFFMCLCMWVYVHKTEHEFVCMRVRATECVINCSRRRGTENTHFNLHPIGKYMASSFSQLDFSASQNTVGLFAIVHLPYLHKCGTVFVLPFTKDQVKKNQSAKGGFAKFALVNCKFFSPSDFLNKTKNKIK